MVDNAKQDSIQLIKEIKAENKGKLNISYEIIKGHPIEEVVVSYAIHLEVLKLIQWLKHPAQYWQFQKGINLSHLKK